MGKSKMDTMAGYGGSRVVTTGDDLEHGAMGASLLMGRTSCLLTCAIPLQQFDRTWRLWYYMDVG